MRTIPVVGGLVLALGCASAPPQAALPGGRPEVVIAAARQAVAAQLGDMFSAGGWTVKLANDYSMVLERPQPSTTMSILYGSSFAGTPNARVTISFSAAGAGTRVAGRLEMVTNPDSGFERVRDVSHHAHGVQQSLLDAKALLEPGDGPKPPIAGPGSP